MAIAIKMPRLSDTMLEGNIKSWSKKIGDNVKPGDILAEVETDKATMDLEAYQEGTLLYIAVSEGPVAVDGLIAIIGKTGEDISQLLVTSPSPGKENAQQVPENSKINIALNEPGEPPKSSYESRDETRVKASPLAKNLAKEKGISLVTISGSGEQGRIVKRDIEHISSKTPLNLAPALGDREVAISQIRKTIARRLTESKFSAPHFYLTIEVDMDNAIASRNAINAIPDTKVSFNDLVIKACAAALRKHPRVNTSWMGDKIRQYSHIHIGVAVAVEDGLLVPVIRFADQKSLSQISAEVKDLGKRAKDKKLQPADWEGNTFTVSNLGMFGIDEFTSIINSPESCILSVGAIKQVPVVKNNQVVPGNVMKVTLACDHRTVDGATGATFLQTLRTYLENPVTILA